MKAIAVVVTMDGMRVKTEAFQELKPNRLVNSFLWCCDSSQTTCVSVNVLSALEVENCNGVGLLPFLARIIRKQHKIWQRYLA